MDMDGKSVLFGVYISSLFRLVSFLHFLWPECLVISLGICICNSRRFLLDFDLFEGEKVIPILLRVLFVQMNMPSSPSFAGEIYLTVAVSQANLHSTFAIGNACVIRVGYCNNVISCLKVVLMISRICNLFSTMHYAKGTISWPNRCNSLHIHPVLKPFCQYYL